MEDYMQALPSYYYLAIDNNSKPGGEAGATYQLSPTLMGFSVAAGNK